MSKEATNEELEAKVAEIEEKRAVLKEQLKEVNDILAERRAAEAAAAAEAAEDKPPTQGVGWEEETTEVQP